MGAGGGQIPGSAQRSASLGEAHSELRKNFPYTGAAPRKRAPSDFLLVPGTTAQNELKSRNVVSSPEKEHPFMVIRRSRVPK